MNTDNKLKKVVNPRILLTDVDGADLKTFAAIEASDEFQEFHKEVETKINDLIDLIEANMKRFNCSVVIGATTLCGEDKNIGGSVWAGRFDSLTQSCLQVLKNYPGKILTAILKKEGIIPASTPEPQTDTQP